MNDPTHSSGMSDNDFRQLDQFAEKAGRQHQLSAVLDAPPSLVQRGAIYIIGAALLILFLILFFGKTHAVVTIKGTILPEGEAVQILALAEGVTTQVLAREGDHLAQGSPILTFSHTKSDMDLASMKRRFKIKQNQFARTQEAFQLAQLILSDPDTYMASDQQTLVSTTTMAAISALKISWISLKKAEQTQGKELKEKMDLMKKEIALANRNIRLKIKNKETAQQALTYQKKGLTVKKQRYEQFLKLAQRGFYSKVDEDNERERYRNAELALITKEKEIDRMALEISNERLGLSEKKLNLKKEQARADEEYATRRLDYQKNLTGLMQEAQQLKEKIATLAADLSTRKDKIALTQGQVSRGTVSMPHDGIITKLEINTPGQSIGSGTVVAVMVADNDRLMVKALAKSKDVGFVASGLSARVKVDAYPFQQFGTIPATVTKVYPNIGGDGQFTVYLKLFENKIDTGYMDIKLRPGLTVSADILTRKQRLIRMLLSKDTQKPNAPQHDL